MTPTTNLAGDLAATAYLVRRLTDNGKPFSSSLRFFDEPSSATVVVEPLYTASQLAAVTAENERLKEALEKVAKPFDGPFGTSEYVPLADMGKELRKRQVIASAALAESS